MHMFKANNIINMTFSCYNFSLATHRDHQQHHVNYLKGFVVVKGLVICECAEVTFIQSFPSH